jgi:hypothetical protein
MRDIMNVSERKRLFQPAAPVEIQISWIPKDTGFSASRYDTDDEHVIHLWKNGVSYDIRIPKKQETAVQGICC